MSVATLCSEDIEDFGECEVMTISADMNMCCNVILWDNCDYSKPVHPPVLGPNIGFWVPCWKIPPPFSLPLHLHLLLRVTLPALRSPKRGACSPGGAPPIPLLLHCRRRPLPLTINWMPTLAVVPLTPRILAWTVPPTPWITTLAVPLILAAVPPSPGLLLQLLHSILEGTHLPLQDIPLPTDWQTKRTSLLVPVVPHLETHNWTNNSSLTGLYQSFSGTFTKLKSLSCSPRKKQGNTNRTNSAITRLLLNIPVMALFLIVQKRYARVQDNVWQTWYMIQNRLVTNITSEYYLKTRLLVFIFGRTVVNPSLKKKVLERPWLVFELFDFFSNPPCWLVRGKFKRIQAVSRSDRRWWRRWRQPKLMGARPGWHEKGNWPKETILPPGWLCHWDGWNLVTMRGSSQHQSQTLNLSHFFKDSDQESDLIRSQPVARYEVSLHSLRALVALCLNLRNGNDDG